jgi:hypothetical protein
MLPAASPLSGPPGHLRPAPPGGSLLYRLDVTHCERCGGPVRIIASLTGPGVLDRILTARDGAELHGPVRGPPQGELALG